MRKSIILILKRIFILVFMCTSFIIALSFILGSSNDKNTNLPGFFMKSKSIIFNDNNGGNIKVYITKQNKVKEIPIEEYVTGVVAGEMPAEFSEEALKAQAVAARTFAVAHMEKYGGKKYKSNTGADVSDDTKCQVFVSKNNRFNTWSDKDRNNYWNKITDAVNSTKGEILTYKGKLVTEPYYFATSSGSTESALEIFNDDKGYLKSVDSPGEEKAPKYKTQKQISRGEFINKINSAYNSSKLSVSNLENDVKIESRTEGGSVKNIKLGYITISGTKFRTLMGINSSNFSINFIGNNVRIQCLGYGHDVGMSQWGANAMAKKGKNYRDILYHYYSGIKIQKMSDIL